MTCPDAFFRYPHVYASINCIAGILNILMGFYIAFLIHCGTPKEIGVTHKRCLFIHETFVCILSAYGCFTAPIHYMPSLLVVFTGVIKINTCHELLITILLQITACTITTACIFVRSFTFSYGQRKSYRLNIVLLIFFVISLCPFISYAVRIHQQYDYDEAIIAFKEDCPDLYTKLKFHRFVYINSIHVLKMMVTTTILPILSFLAVAVFSIFFHCYFIMFSNSNISENAKKMQIKLLYDLVAQCVLPCLFHGLPLIVAILGSSLQLKISVYVGAAAWFANNLHGIFNGVVIILLNQHYCLKTKKCSILYINDMVFSLGIDIVDAHPLNCKTKNKILYIDPPLPESRSCFTRMKMKWCEIVRTSFPNGEELSVTLGVSTKVVMVALMIIYSMIVQAYVRTSKSSEDEFSYLNAGTMAVMHFIGIQMMVVSSIYHMPYLMVPVMAHDMFLLLSSILTIVSDFLPIFIMFTDRNSYVLDVPYPVIVIATICRLVNTSLQMRIYQFLTGFEVKTVRRSDI